MCSHRCITFSWLIVICSTLLFAGHESTSNSLTWYLWEIAKHPESQERVRAEIISARAKNGGKELSIVDLDSMTFTRATLKVCWHYIVIIVITSYLTNFTV
jgi:alkylphenol/PAH-inducible cytochrome P450 monooxygenase